MGLTIKAKVCAIVMKCYHRLPAPPPPPPSSLFDRMMLQHTQSTAPISQSSPSPPMRPLLPSGVPVLRSLSPLPSLPSHIPTPPPSLLSSSIQRSLSPSPSLLLPSTQPPTNNDDKQKICRISNTRCQKNKNNIFSTGNNVTM
eukprot:Awhi_evm1s14900